MNKFFFLFIFFAACFVQASLAAAEEVTLQIVSVRDYCSMLNGVAVHDPLQLYSDEMAADREACGILRTETPEGYSYTMIAGMEDQPMRELSQSQHDYYVHWVGQGSLQGEEELTSPLMMFGEHGKEDPEQAAKELVLKQQQQERNRQATDEEESDSSGSEQRGQKAAAIKEGSSSHQPPREIIISTSPDDISEMTGDFTTLERNPRSTSFSPKGGVSLALLHQAEDQLREAREGVAAARRHFDLSQGQWEASRNLELASKNHSELQGQLARTYPNWWNADRTFHQAQAGAHEAWSRSDPSYADLNQIVTAAGMEVHRTFQEHQALLFLAQSACQNYYFAQQRGSQQGLMPGVDYTSLFSEAQLRANRAADQLDKCQQAVRRIKFEKPSPPKQKGTGALYQKTTAPVGSQQRTAAVIQEAAVHLEQLVEVSKMTVLQQVESLSKSSAADSEKISYEDKGTQIAEEDLAVWKREALLKKQALWKSRFHKMVEKIKQLKEAVTVDFSKKLLHEVSQEFVLNVAQTSLEEGLQAAAEAHAAETRRIAEEQKAEQMALAPTIVDTLIEEAFSAKWVEKYFKQIAKQAKRELFLEKKERIFNGLFYSNGDASEHEKWEQQQQSAARIQRTREQQRVEMEQFCREHMKLMPPVEEAGAKNVADDVVPLIQRAGDILTQCYRGSYEWCSDAVQLMQDWKIILPEAGRTTNKFFADQGRGIQDVPTTEYALKSGQVAQQLYNELVTKRRQEEAAAKAAARERDPREELGYFEQMPYVLEGPVFKRFAANLFGGKIHDPNRESDERAIDYFKEIGKPAPRIFEFWKKSAEIEEQLKKERLEKAKEFLEQFPDEEERLCIAQKWGVEWRERLQQERQQKENEKLERDLFAKEEQCQRIVQAVMDQRAAQEAERQQIEKEILDQEAKGKAQRQSTKKKIPKKK